MSHSRFLLLAIVAWFPCSILQGQPATLSHDCTSCDYFITDTVVNPTYTLASGEVLCIQDSAHVSGSWNVIVDATAMVVNCGTVEFTGNTNLSQGMFVNNGYWSFNGHFELSGGAFTNNGYLDIGDDFTISSVLAEFVNLDTIIVAADSELIGFVVNEAYWFSGGLFSHLFGTYYSETSSLVQAANLTVTAALQGPIDPANGCMSFVIDYVTIINTLLGMDGTIDICDLTPSIIYPFTVDVLTGLLGGNVTHCECVYEPDEPLVACQPPMNVGLIFR